MFILIDVNNESDIEHILKDIAQEKISGLITHTLREFIGEEILSEIQLNPNPQAEDLGAEMHRVAVRSSERISTIKLVKHLASM